jgi:hypothetical protein
MVPSSDITVLGDPPPMTASPRTWQFCLVRDSISRVRDGGGGCGDSRGFSILRSAYKELSAKGDALERLTAVVDFDLFRADLERAVPRSDGSNLWRHSLLVGRPWIADRQEILRLFEKFARYGFIT